MRTGTLFVIAFIITKSNPFTNSACLKTSEIGVYEQFFLIAGFVSVFWLTGMLQSFLSIFNNNNSLTKNEQKSAFFNLLFLFTIFGLFAAIIVYFCQTPIAYVIEHKHITQIPYLKILLLYIIFSCPANLVEYFYFLKNNPKKILIYGIITFLAQLIFVIFPIWFTQDLGYGLYGLVFVNFSRFIWAIILAYKYSQIKFSREFVKKYLKLSVPLILGAFISSSAFYINSFMILHKFDLVSFAIFRYGREFPLIPILITSYANAIVPSFSNKENFNATLNTLKKDTSRLMNIFFPISFIILLLSKFLFPIIFNINFSESAILFNIYFFMLLGRFIFARSILLGLQKTKILFFASIIEVVVNIVLCFILINYLNIIGVVIAIVIASLIEKLFLLLYLKKTLNIELSNFLNISLYAKYSLILIICFCISLFFL
jgi:O-antigen/teichoic acid export membrane protein